MMVRDSPGVRVRVIHLGEGEGFTWGEGEG